MDFEISKPKFDKIQIADELLAAFVYLKQNFELNQRRWIWELLQNCKNFCYKGEIKVKIDLKPDYLEFSHTGKPFKIKDFEYLIKESAFKPKKNELEKEKYFNNKGTFFKTHVLSKKLKVIGVLQINKKQKIYKNFELNLNRTAQTQNKMIKKIEKSLQVFQKLDDAENLTDFVIGKKINTKFTYELDERGRNIAMQGLDDLQNSIFLTMLFNKEIISIRIHDHLRNYKANYSYVETIFYPKVKGDLDKSIFSMEIFQLQNEKETIKKNFLTIKDEALDIQTVFELGIENNNYFLTPKNPLSPIIFSDFPLIGSENFPFPCFFNSHQFKSNENKSSLLMKGESKAVTLNKSFLMDLKQQTKKFMKFICFSEKPIFNKHLMALTKIPKNFDEVWYQKSIQKSFRKTLYNLPIIENNDGKYIPLVECMIPASKSEFVLVLYDLIQPIFNQKMIKKDLNYIQYWLNEFDHEWEQIFNEKKLFDIFSLLDFVNGKKEINELKTRLKFKHDEIFDWLNRIFQLMHETMPKNECDKILDNLALIPNQNGQLMKLDELYEDSEIPDVLKNFLFNLEIDIGKNLIDNNIYMEAKKKWGISAVILEIQEYFDNNKNKEDILLNSSIEMLSIIPKKTNKNSKFLLIRESLLEIAQVLFEFPIKMKEIGEMPFQLWEKAETFLLKQIAKIIENNINIKQLVRVLKKDKEFVLRLLNKFYEIIDEHDLKNLISDKKVFPNQLGDFRLFKDLKSDSVERDFAGKCPFKQLELQEKNKFDVSVNLNRNFFEPPPQNFYQSLSFLNLTIDETGFDLQNNQQLTINKNQMRFAPVQNLDNNSLNMTTIEFVDNPNQFNLNNKITQINFNSQQQFRKLIQEKQIQLPPKFETSQYDYVKRITERAKKDVYLHLSKNSNYDLSEAVYDETAPNQNILINVRKNQSIIHIVVKPSDGNKIIFGSKRELNELEIAENEFWCSNGILPPQQISNEQILKNS